MALYNKLYETLVVLTYNEAVENNVKTQLPSIKILQTINNSQVILKNQKGGMRKHSNAAINK